MSTEEFDDDFDASSPSLQNETPTMDKVLLTAIDQAFYDIHTSLPCEVVSVNAATGFVDVQPTLKRKYTDGTLTDLPVVRNCPVNHPRGANWRVRFPIAAGDKGVVLFSERSLDAWSASGKTVDPADPRHHHISDGIFVPGLYSEVEPMPASDGTDLVVENGDSKASLKESGDMVLENGTATVTIGADGTMVLDNGVGKLSVLPTGKFRLENTTNELLSVLSDLIDTLINAQVPTLLGPQPFVPPTLLQLQQEKTKLTTLKG